MQSSLSKTLEVVRLKSKSEFEKGEYFEKLVKVFLENDSLQGQNYDKVWLFKDWAKEQGYGDIPESLQFYIDYDAIARDLAVEYSETVIAGSRVIYRCG